METMNNKKIVFYTIYKADNDDLQYITNFDKLDDISNYLNIKKTTLKVMISKKQKIKDQFIVIKDFIDEYELIN